MKKLLFVLVIILIASPLFAQEKPAKADSTLFKKYMADIERLQAQGTKLETDIKGAQEELQRIIGRIQAVQQYAADEKKRLDAKNKPKEEKK